MRLEDSDSGVGLDMPSTNGALLLESHSRKATEVLRSNLASISGAVASRESRLAFGRVLRTTASVRGLFTDSLLRHFLTHNLTQTATKTTLLYYLQESVSV